MPRRTRWIRLLLPVLLAGITTHGMPARAHPDHPPPARGAAEARDEDASTHSHDPDDTTAHYDDEETAADKPGRAARKPRQLRPDRTLIATGFETGDPLPFLPKGRFVADPVHAGDRAVRFDIANRGAEVLCLPVFNVFGQWLDGDVWLRSDQEFSGRILMDAQKQRIELKRFTLPAYEWTKVSFEFNGKPLYVGMVYIVAEAPGRLWMDDLSLQQVSVDAPPRTRLRATGRPSRLDRPFRLDHAEDFPALAADRQGSRWLAVVARGPGLRSVYVYREDVDGARRRVATLDLPGVTGIDAPAIAGLQSGCVVAVPMEKEGVWRLYYAFIRPDQPVELRAVEQRGSANLEPALAVAGDRACVLWESNGGQDHRCIYASWLTPVSASKPIRLSSEKHGSYNATVAAMADGALVAAWDSFRDEQGGIYGARYRDGRWDDEIKLTESNMLERFPSLAVRGDEIWMAWQMAMFPPMRLNNVKFKRVRVARLTWRKGFHNHEAAELETDRENFIRPKLSIDPDGRIWVTTRWAIDRNGGWLLTAFCHPGRWAGPYLLWPYRGRIRPSELVWTPRGGAVAAQFDDLETFGGHNKGGDWQCETKIRMVRADSPASGRAEHVAWPPVPAVHPIKPGRLGLPPADQFSLPQYRVQSSATFGRQRATNRGENYTLYFGTLHEHTDMSVCVRNNNPTVRELYQNAREIDQLDFIALTDHGFSLTQVQWTYNMEQVRANEDKGKFLTLLGQEWTSQKVPYNPPRAITRYGHHNLIFADMYDQFFDSNREDLSPTELWSRIKGVDFITIPHQLADHISGAPVDWTEHDDTHQPLAEIFQNRGSYEALGAPRQAEHAMKVKGHYLQDAWAMGVTIGVIASPDHGGGGGKAGVWAKDLTRESLFEAFHARRTFGTSAPKMSLLVNSGDHLMGEVVRRDDDKALTFRIRAEAMRPFVRLVIMRNNEIVHDINPTSKKIDCAWTDPAPPHEDRLWYYVRMHRDDEELAWSSPIWFDRSTRKTAALPVLSEP